MDSFSGKRSHPEPAGRGTSSEARPGTATTALPAIQLPKGGGAIRGIGEKFAANPATGNGAMSVPIAVSPGRAGFGPKLTLSYDSGAGNGPFGFGWNLSIAAITRKTDQGLPQYRDAQLEAEDDSDVFILSGAEDLVPVYRQDEDGTWVAAHAGYARDADGGWVRDSEGRLVVHEDERDGYRVRRYRPRIESLFARIERWTKVGEPTDVHWRSISKENVLTVFGVDRHSRIADPQDAARIFSWLTCETRDDRGNAVLYRYKAEDGAGIDLGMVCERNRGNRTDPRRTANRYLQRIHYGNRSPLLDNTGRRLRFLDYAAIDAQIAAAGWMFEVVFDYGDHDPAAPAPRDDEAKLAGGALRYPWPARADAFSSYRAGFEVRTSRVCRRVLMFHHFPAAAGSGVGADCLVRSHDLVSSSDVDPADVRNPVYTFLQSVTQTGYGRRAGGGYDRRSFPPLEFEYSQPVVQDRVEEVDAESLKDLPIGLDGREYRWTDLHGEGLPGILTEQAGTWFYKRNVSPMPAVQPDGTAVSRAQFSSLETVSLIPNAALASGAELMDLAGDGQPDLVVMDGATQGLFEHDDAEGWAQFRPFASRLNRDLRDANLRFVDLDGDGHADVLITENDALVWYPSRAEEGFGPARRMPRALDEEEGPRVLFADVVEALYLADLNGDGLSDIVRIRNGEVSYWPNLGYGRFGARVVMNNSPRFEEREQFDHRRIRLADIDGSGTTDIIYLHRDGVILYFNQSGNGWGQPQMLTAFPRIDSHVVIVPVDLLGTGTTCLVWSSPLPHDTRRAMRYVDLMGGRKPHLLIGSQNNLGAETRIEYAPSTKFYLQDQRAGTPWIRRLPFPVQVVEKVETFDRISRNRFVTRYVYHHGHYDGEEREFRGFGMVEQWDTESLGVLAASSPVADNVEPASHVPPVCTRTWFHTGAYFGRDRVSDYFAGLLNDTDKGEYFREPGLTDDEARALLLPDTAMPGGLTAEEEVEACRALKGAMLRQETYAQDAGSASSAAAQARAATPFVVTEQNFTIRTMQPRGGHRYGVFFTHTRETITFTYERVAADPRIAHGLTLEADRFGNVLKQAAVGYGRRNTITQLDALGQAQKVANPGLNGLLPADVAAQTTPLVTYSEFLLTTAADSADEFRAPMAAEARTFELTGYARATPGRYEPSDFVEADPARPGRLRHKFAGEVPFEATAAGAFVRRLVECKRTLYRRSDLTNLRPLGQLDPMALEGETYTLAFTPGLLTSVFQRPRAGQSDEALIPNPAVVLGGQAGDRGGYLQSQALKADGRFPATDPDDEWWMPGGRTFHTATPADTPAVERTAALQHFFRAVRHRDAFGQDTFVTFDADDLLQTETRDALGNRITVDANDYRVLQPRLVSDANRNRIDTSFDLLGFVVGTATMGKPAPAQVEGDNLAGFAAEVTPAQLAALLEGMNPRATALALLQDATTRVVYDVDRFHRTRLANPANPASWEPACAVTIARETHASAPLPPQGLGLQLTFSYSDGFGREVQKQMQAEPGSLVEGGPTVSPRWVASGWTIFDNKGNPVRQYEPFFSNTQRFTFGVRAGVTPVLFYDAMDRVIATIRPNHTFEKVVIGAWQQSTYDMNDTCAPRNGQTGDPRTDPDIAGWVGDYFLALPVNAASPWRTWHAQRIAGALGPAERDAAERAAAHADTPTTALLDPLGRPFALSQRNRVVCAGHDLDGSEDAFTTRVELDIQGNHLQVRDAAVQAGDGRGRVVMRYGYDLLGNRIREISMERGRRWTLSDAAGTVIRSWDSRGHNITTMCDALRRMVRRSVRGTTAASDPRTLNRDLVFDSIEYGEGLANAEALNLRTRVYRHSDTAGQRTNARLDAAGNPTAACDFKGNVLFTTRRLLRDYADIPDWSANPPLDAERFEATTQYDALDRPVQFVAPHSNRPGTTRHIVQPAYNEASLLDRVEVWLERAAEPPGLLDPAVDAPSPVGVASVEYDARGKRRRIDYRNGATTHYRYDAETFRLAHLYTRRGAAFTEDCENPAPPPATIAAPERPPDGKWCGLQQLHYTYDPEGNVTRIEDAAQQPVYFRNRRIDPANDYIYDAVYRLIHATGREHLGLNGGARNQPTAPDGFNLFPSRQAHPGDGDALGTYIERFVYDAVGNFLEVQHRGSDPVSQGWTRAFSAAERSAIEDGAGGTLLKTSNRLSETTLAPAGPAPQPEVYQHDPHGNIVRMPHLGNGGNAANMHWDYQDRLRQVDRGGGGTVHFVYDANGQRVRKVWEKNPGLVEERIYIGDFEVFRRHGGPIGPGTATLERETVHVMDDRQRIALVETRSIDVPGTDTAPRRLVRYQLGNHLGSACLELDDQTQIVSYEEYAPYGSTTYQAVRAQTDTPKRYRFTGKEHDEESGLYYFGQRYYAAWLGRWVSCDPAGLDDAVNLYGYVRQSPVARVDADGRKSTKIIVEGEVIVLDDAGKVKKAKTSRSVEVVDDKGKVTVLKKTERDMNKKERAAAQKRMDELKKEIAAEKAREEQAERERNKPPDKYKIVLAINVSSVDKKGAVQITGGPDGNPGHTFLAIKDPSGKIVRILSYGPKGRGGLAAIGCSAPGDPNYHLLSADVYETYEWDITKEQSEQALKKIAEIQASPGTYDGVHQCTTVALQVTDAAGLTSIPRGKGNIDIPICDNAIDVSTPYHLNKELKAGGAKSTNMKGSDFKDLGVPVN